MTARATERKVRDAFTIIELLVVVAIIALLASILLAGVSKGIAAAKATECRHNLRDIGLALRMFLDDEHAYPGESGSMNIVGARDIFEWRDPSGWIKIDGWKMQVGPYLGCNGSDQAQTMWLRKMRCPLWAHTADGLLANGQYAFNAFGTAKLTSPTKWGLGGNYAKNGSFQRTQESHVKVPGNMIAAGDIERLPSPTPGFLWTQGFFDVPSTNQAFWPGSLHNGSANMLFCDGHVDSGRQAVWVSTNASSRARWNSDNNPHPESWKRP